MGGASGHSVGGWVSVYEPFRGSRHRRTQKIAQLLDHACNVFGDLVDFGVAPRPRQLKEICRDNLKVLALPDATENVALLGREALLPLIEGPGEYRGDIFADPTRTFELLKDAKFLSAIL